jgi:hypothetical protein
MKQTDKQLWIDGEALLLDDQYKRAHVAEIEQLLQL